MKPLHALLLGCLLLAACSPARAISTPTLAPSLPAALTPYQTLTPAPTDAPAAQAPADSPALDTPPAPTPTPRIHVVRSGEDMGGIAYAYHITVQALREANPGVDPHAMTVGTRLVIPGTAPGPDPATPTAESILTAGVHLGPVRCFSTVDGGGWCFLTVTNDGPGAAESVTARVRVLDAQGQALEQILSAPLDLLSPGSTSGLAAFFPAPFPAGPYQAGAQLLTALPLENPAARYRPAHVEDLHVDLAANSLSATVSGTLLIEGDAPAAQARIALTAYDAQGQVVGIRRWESPSGQSIPPGQKQPFQLTLYSAAGSIARVESAVEAR